MSASFVVLRCWWLQFTKPDGQLILMSEFKLMERFVAHTRVRTVLRGAESYHAFGTAQSFTRDVAKTFGTTLLNASSIEI